MFSHFKKTISLSNLQAGSKSGQIATFLILMITAALIFILVTVNLGQLSVTATNLSNAADSAALSLASQLATRANMIYHTKIDEMDGDMLGLKACKNISILATIAAILLSTIAAFFTFGTGYLLVATMLAGAAGGAIGGEIAGTGAGQGALQGMAIGAAIGGGVSMLGGAVTLGPGAVGAPTYGAGVGFAGLDGMLAVSASSLPVGVLSSLGAAAGATLAAGSELYSGYVGQKAQITAFSVAAKALSGYNEYDRFRESVFLQALSQVVDDPEKVIDADDLDGDGETADEILRFYKWWNQRTEELKAISSEIEKVVDKFLHGSLVRFRNFAERQYTKECHLELNGPGIVCLYGPLCRREVEGEDGAIIDLFRAPGWAGFGVWKPGPDKKEIKKYVECECDSEGEEDDSCCPAPAKYDEVDGVIDELKEFAGLVDGMLVLNKAQLASTWQSWFKGFYNSEATDGSGAFYDSSNEIVGRLEDWRSKIKEKRKTLPDCVYKKEHTGGHTFDYNLRATNYPCKDDSRSIFAVKGESRGFFATIDADADDDGDEFTAAVKAIDALIEEIAILRSNIEKFKAEMDRVYDESKLDEHGGLNPVTYEWDDSRGKHKVIAEVGPYKIAWVDPKKEGPWYKRKACLYLRDYADDGSRTWVRLTRKDPAGSAIGRIGAWNVYDNYDPYDDGPDNASNRQKAESDGFFSVSRVSRARYRYAGDNDAFVELVRW